MEDNSLISETGNPSNQTSKANNSNLKSKIDWSKEKDNLENYINKDRLSLREIANKYGVSDTPVRRAIEKLGIVRTAQPLPKSRKSYSIDDLKIAVSKSHSYSEVCRNLNIVGRGDNIGNVRKTIEDNNICTDHFQNKGKKETSKKIDTKDLLKENINHSSSDIKQRLINENMKPHKCEICGKTEWNGKPIPLELHHINGNHSDNRLENLQILCPNCHAQTDNYRGRGTIKNYSLKLPNREDFLNKFKELRTVKKISEYYKVCDSTIRDWVKRLDLVETINNLRKSNWIEIP